MVMPNNESVDYQIRINAVQALKSLEDVMTRAASVPDAIAQIELATQALADKFGVGFGVAQKEMTDTIRVADTLRAALAEMQMPSFGIPLLDETAGVKSPYGGMGLGAGQAAVNEAHRERISLLNAERKSQEMLAKESNQQAVTQAKIKAEREKTLSLAQQEQALVEKEGAELSRQLKLYGQVGKTQSDILSNLRSFSKTTQGESILTKFLGDFQSAGNVIPNQIASIKSAITGLSTATGASFSQSGQIIKEQFSQIPGITGKVNQAVKEMGDNFERTSKRAVRGVDAIRIALGVLVSMLIFSVMQAISNAFRTAIDNLRETELAVYNLINAERRLSEMGIDVTPKGLQETIEGVQKLVPILSRIQAEELVSRVATNVAPALKLTEVQVRQLSESIALLYTRNKALGYSFDEIEKAITDAFLTGKVSQGINKFGVKISDQIVRDEALRLGLVKTAEEFDNLTGEMEAQVKAAAMLSVVYKNATQDVESLDDYLKTTDATIESTSAVWNDLLTILGEISAPAIQEFLAVITRRLESMKAWLEANKEEVIRLVAAFAGLARGVEFLSDLSFMDRLKNPIQNFKGFIQAIYDGMQEAKEGMTNLADAADTPTAAIDDLQEALDSFDADEFGNKIEDILTDIAQAREDLDTKMSRKLEDLDTEYVQKAADAYRDYQRDVADINKDAEQRRADAIRKSREKDLEAERDYQNKLWELRMRFLMDLEDALHARDARQIIRLQKQYAIDKESLLRKKKLDDQSRKEDLDAELAQIELQRQRKLEDAKLDYEQKLADQRKAKQRELEDLNQWYAREQADLRQHLQRKMEDLIRAWIQEGKITQQGAQQVYDILRTYFGPGGLTDQLYQYMQSQFAASMSVPMGNVPLSTYGTIGTHDTGESPRPPRSSAGFAEGGTLIATRPMTATFGEVPEAVTFTPLDSPGNNVGRMFGDKSSLGGGVLELLLTLSPDLESRIVQKSMDNVGDVIVKVNRSRA